MTDPHLRAWLKLLRQGQMSVEGRLVDASNATLYCAIVLDDLSAHCVYKPIRGERPLWDFPDGTLAGREVAAYAVSAATGWEVVPPTVMRTGEFGRGMVQLWIDIDDSVDLIELIRSDSADLRRMSLFDAVVNNADRKGGHLIPTVDGHVYGVDHGICFNVEDKLRTVLWNWAGQPIPDEHLVVLERLYEQIGPSPQGRRAKAETVDGDLGKLLRVHLAEDEVIATRDRIAMLLANGVHPQPPAYRHAVPWPPI